MGLAKLGPSLLLQRGWGIKLDFFELQNRRGRGKRISVPWAFNKIDFKEQLKKGFLNNFGFLTLFKSFAGADLGGGCRGRAPLPG